MYCLTFVSVAIRSATCSGGARASHSPSAQLSRLSAQSTLLVLFLRKAELYEASPLHFWGPPLVSVHYVRNVYC